MTFFARIARLVLVCAIAASMTNFATAAITFAGSQGTLSAQAVFDVNGSNQLVVTLTNTSMSDVLEPKDVLTAIFFDIAGTGELSPVSAVLWGSTVIYDPDGQPAGGSVGGEWGYGSGLSGAPLGATQGISSSGLGGLFGQPNFSGDELGGPTNGALDGLQYGLVSAGDDPSTGNGGVKKDEGLIMNAVQFILDIETDGFALASGSISNVSFQYGTGLYEPNVPGDVVTITSGAPLPEPMSLAVWSMLGAMAVLRWRRRHK